MPPLEEQIAQFKGYISDALEMSKAIGNPAALRPDELGHSEEDFWSPEDDVVLELALVEHFSITPSDLLERATRRRDATIELSDHPDADGNVIYIQWSDGHRVFLVGQPGFDFGE